MPQAAPGQAAPNFKGTLNMQPQGLPLNTNPTTPVLSPIQPPSILQAPQGQPAGLLDPASRSKLDSIVMQMASKNAPQADVQAVVADFKSKYAQAPQQQPAYDPGSTAVPTPLQIEGAKVAAKGSLYQILQQAHAGEEQVGQGLGESINAKNPLQFTGGLLNTGSGVVNTLFSPAAPILQPIGRTINDKVVQPAANALESTFGSSAERGLADMPTTAAEQAATGYGNAANIAGAFAGVEEVPKLPGQVSSFTSNLATKATDLVTPSLEHDVGKALGFTGKMNAGTALQKTTQSTRALQTLVDNAPNIKVTDANGIQVPFEPSKATFAETLDAFQQTKDAIYEKYTAQAGEAADFTAKDFLQVETMLNNVSKNSTGAFKAKAASIVKDLQENYGTVNPITGDVYYKNTPATDIQEFIQKLNTDVNPLSDKAGAQVSQAASQSLRSVLDDKIEAAPGKGYQDLRNQYGDLKSIESDLVNQFKKAARGQGGTIAKLIEGFGALDVVLAVMKGSPIEAAAGVGGYTIGKIMENLKDPTHALQRAFKKLQRSQSNENPLNTQASNSIAPIVPKNSNIPESIPQSSAKASPAQSAPAPESTLSFIKNNMNSEKGFIANPFKKTPSGKAINDIHPEDLQTMHDFINHARIKTSLTDAQFSSAEKLAERFGISMDKGISNVANEFAKILEGQKKVKGTVEQGRDNNGRFK